MNARKSRNAVKIRDDNSSRDNSIIMDVSTVEPPEYTVEKTTTFSRDTSNSSRNSQL
jgi:hypothetical protein